MDECPMCIGHKIELQVTDWIQCSKCLQWYHLHCLNLTKKQSEQYRTYNCAKCAAEYGEGELRRVSKRQRTSVDYVALNSGEVESVVRDNHPHVVSFMSSRLDDSGVVVKAGDELTTEFVLENRLVAPVKVPAHKTEGLGLSIPAFSIADLTKSMGPESHIEIMDVLTQNSARNGWNLGQWAEYFAGPSTKRERILNVLSLEISDCSLGEAISRPKFVEDLDLVDLVWPQGLAGKPCVKKYCLMGVEKSFTDFHLDFAGSSVYYTVLSGEKHFMLFPPTDANLKKYTKWVQKFSNVFLDDFFGLEKGVKLVLKPGDVLIIPSGWIHSVYTPVDTVVIGGNFLTQFNIETQLKIVQLEQDTKVGKKFRFPKFESLMWFLADKLANKQLAAGVDSPEKLYAYLEDKKPSNEVLKYINYDKIKQLLMT